MQQAAHTDAGVATVLPLPQASVASSAADQVIKVGDASKRIQQAVRHAVHGWVEGEVQQVSQSGAGHLYLDLTDGEAVLRAVLWKGRVAQLPALPVVGDLVQAHVERVDVYARSGGLSLILDDLKATGEGALLARKAEVLGRLQADGLLDPARKRPLPPFPRRVAIVSGRDSDALADVTKAIRDRWPAQDLVVCPALVQGVAAPSSIISALLTVQALDGVDVIVLARGGGSVTDLAAFDDEELCRVIAGLTVPVVTSIGHTKQRPAVDHVASAFADVPGRTAELVVRSARGAIDWLAGFAKDRAAVTAGIGLLSQEIRRTLNADSPVHQVRSLLGDLQLAAHELQTARDAPATYARELAADAADMRRSSTEFFAAHATNLKAAGQDLEFARRDLVRRHRDYREAIDRLAGERRTAGARALADIRKDVTHTAEIIAAHDPRGRGWALLQDEHGTPITTTAALTAGQHVRLSLADGDAALTVDTVGHHDHADPTEETTR